MDSITPRDLARRIDQTLLKPEATGRQIEELCRDARQHQFYSVCVNGSRVMQAYDLLQESGVKVCAVVGFPLGAMDADSKRFETEAAIDNGAHEIDAVLNIGRLKDGDHGYVLRELRDIAEAAEERLVKAILETGLLTRQEIITACKLALDSGAQFVKTSTGFGPRGATVEDVQLLREQVGPNFGVKASGGIRHLKLALALLQAGADRLGTSAGPLLMEELSARRVNS